MCVLDICDLLYPVGAEEQDDAAALVPLPLSLRLCALARPLLPAVAAARWPLPAATTVILLLPWARPRRVTPLSSTPLVKSHRQQDGTQGVSVAC